jgi:cyclophilin family peptidyl-prolyl cis-trans isomerase
MRVLLIAAVLAAVLASACGGDSDDDGAQDGETTVQSGFDANETPGSVSSSDQTPAASGTTANNGGAPSPGAASGTPGGQPAVTPSSKQSDEKPPMTIDANKRYFATIKMDIGDIKLELFPQDAPETVNSFVLLSREGFYNGITFHRVIEGFDAQAGDPTGTGTGGPGYTIPDEVNDRKFLDGTMGMAKTSAPNSGGSQFYICYTPQPRLDGSYTVFGQIVEGREVLDLIAPREPSAGGPPGTVINTIEIEEQG